MKFVLEHVSPVNVNVNASRCLACQVFTVVTVSFEFDTGGSVRCAHGSTAWHYPPSNHNSFGPSNHVWSSSPEYGCLVSILELFEHGLHANRTGLG